MITWREAHAHLFEHGRAMDFVQLSGCGSLADALGALSRAAGAGPDEPDEPDENEWLIAVGARPEGWREARWPTRAELREAIGDRPACIWCFDWHALLTNEPGLSRAAISREELDRLDGQGFIERAGGTMTGVLLEDAAGLVWSRIEPPSGEARRRVLRRAMEDLAAKGCVEVHDLKSQPWLGRELAAMDDEQPLPLRVRLFPLVEHLAEVAADRKAFERERIALAGGKLFTDGTLNSRTAWMLHPYADAPPEHPTGLKMATEREIEAAVAACDALGLPLATHAIGDGSVRAVLDAIERVKPATTGFRIEHAELVDRADIPRFAQLGVVCSPQPCHLLTDIEVLERFLPHRLDRVLPLRELLDSGLAAGQGLIFGSDTPIVRPDPADSILAATARGRGDGHTIAPEQAIGVDEAWACFAAGG